MNITILAMLPDFALTGVIVAAGFFALIFGWIIHPWTVGGLTRWVESPMQQFIARVTTSTLWAFGVMWFGGMFMAIAFPTWSFAKIYDEHSKSSSAHTSAESDSSGSSGDDPFAEPIPKTPVVTRPTAPPPIRKAEPAVVRPTTELVVPTEPSKAISREITTTRPAPEVVETPREKTSSKPESEAIKPSTDSVQLKVAELKGELAALDTKIQAERNRWQEGVNVINRLTNFKRTPVREGSPQYHQCMAASRVIKEVEAGAAGLKAEKARLEAMIQSLENK